MAVWKAKRRNLENNCVILKYTLLLLRSECIGHVNLILMLNTALANRNFYGDTILVALYLAEAHFQSPYILRRHCFGRPISYGDIVSVAFILGRHYFGHPISYGDIILVVLYLTETLFWSPYILRRHNSVALYLMETLFPSPLS